MRREKNWSGFVSPDRERSVYAVGGPSLTRQEFAEECDINNIMVRYEQTGVISHFNDGVPRYIDLTDFPDTLQGTLEMLQEAEGAFMTLPARVRAEFENDPVRFVEFAGDPNNLSQMREWGLAPPEAVVSEHPAAKPPEASSD